MRIINTIKNSKVKLLPFYFLLFTFLIGCVQDTKLKKAKEYIKESNAFYERAVDIYKDLVAKGKDVDKLHFELGKIYYDHGKFQEAIAEFKQSDTLLAKKFLGISLYLTNSFTDALEIFAKFDLEDPEFLYYYGLTCERLNLFDKAITLYQKINNEEFLSLALKRIHIIERETSKRNLKDIDQEAFAIIQSSPDKADYPQAGALILLCDEKIKLTEDTQSSRFHYMVKILNERGKESFSETQIEYDSTFEKVELEFARTIKPDGEVIDVGSRHIRDVSKYLNFPLYSNVRVFIISFPEITEGAVIEYSVKIYRNQLINKKDFILSYPVQFPEPIILATFFIDGPKDKTLHIKTLNTKYNNFNAKLDPDIVNNDEHITYSWQFKDIPQIIPESNMPANAEINPSMLISTFSSWQEVYDWWWRLAKDKIKVCPEIKQKVNDLVKDQDSAEAKARAIYNFCAKEIRYVAVEYGQAGHEPHKAEDIFKNKYGDCKDQAILLVTMLKEAGIKAYPVLIPTKSYYNIIKDFPSVHFNHVIAAVSLEGEMIFLDPTAETCSFGDLPPGDQDRGVLVFKEDKYELNNTPLFPAQHNLNRRELFIKINPDESITAQRNVFTYGMYEQAQRYWLLYTPPQLIEESLKEAIQEISIGATLQDYEIENLSNLDKPVVLSYKFKGSEYLTAAGSLRIMPQLSGIDVVTVAKEERRYPIDFGILSESESIITYEIPKNFIVKYTPSTVIEDSPWIKFVGEYSYEDNKLLFKQQTELKKRFIEESEYPDFKVFLENLAKKIKQRVILEEIK